jgi:hypothetical protein
MTPRCILQIAASIFAGKEVFSGPAVPALSDRFHIVAPDLPASHSRHGFSYTFARLVRS